MSLHLSGRGKLGEEDKRIFKSKVFTSKVQQKLLDPMLPVKNAGCPVIKKKCDFLTEYYTHVKIT